MNTSADSQEDPRFYAVFYNEELYDLPEPSASADVPGNSIPGDSAGFFPFSGDVNAKTLVMFSYPETGDITPADKQFLSQVLMAVQLGFEKVCRLNTAELNPDIRWEDIASATGADMMIAFGVGEQLLPEGIKEGEIYTVRNKRVLCASGLPELSANNNRKKMLWNGLKELYGL
jgi:hypothetical protein